MSQIQRGRTKKLILAAADEGGWDVSWFHKLLVLKRLDHDGSTIFVQVILGDDGSWGHALVWRRWSYHNESPVVLYKTRRDLLLVLT